MVFQVIGAIVLGLSIIIGVGSRRWLKTDNIIEETAEVIIKNKTGCDIDLSPDTPDGGTPDGGTPDKDDFNFFHKMDVLEEKL